MRAMTNRINIFALFKMVNSGVENVPIKNRDDDILPNKC